MTHLHGCQHYQSVIAGRCFWNLFGCQS